MDKKYDKREVIVQYDAPVPFMHLKPREYINALLEYGYEVNNNNFPSPENKPRARGDTDQPVQKEVCAWNGI